MRLIKSGTTRYVLIVGSYALKFPRPSSLRCFLSGMLHNMNESAFSTMNIELLCPIFVSIPAGLLNVMPACKVGGAALRSWRAAAGRHEQSALLLGIVEMKADSAGMLNGRPVAVDYGTY